MKKRNCLVWFPLLAALMVFASCATSSGTGSGSGDPAPQPAKNIERIRVDYKGAAIGSEVPSWLEAAVDNDLETIKKEPRFKGKVPIVDYGTGQNLDLLRSWVNNFNVQAAVARRIKNYVEAEFGGKQLGDKDTAENRSFLEETVATISKIEINGLSQEMDYWIKLRTKDNDKGTETEQYYYYVIYSIAEEDLNYQIAQAMGKISAKTKDQEEIKADVEDALLRARYNSIQAAE
jgi:hypothetical protein